MYGDTLTPWGCGVIALLQITVGVSYGIARREIRFMIARQQSRQEIPLQHQK